MATIPTVQWKLDIQTHNAMAKACLAVDDFSYFRARAALTAKAPQLLVMNFHTLRASNASHNEFVSMAAAPATNTTSGDNEIKSLVQQQSADIKNQSEVAIKAIEQTSKDQSGSKDDWKARMLAKVAEQKTIINKAMDDHAEQAMKKIDQLPEERRNEEANKWVSAQDWIMQQVQKFLEAWGEMIDSVVKFFQDVYQGIVNTINKVKSVVIDAYQTTKTWIESIF